MCKSGGGRKIKKQNGIRYFCSRMPLPVLLICCYRSTCYKSRYGAQYSDDYLYDLAPATW